VVIVTSNIPRSAPVPAWPAGGRLVGALDVEWSKNYKVRGGNVPFCYSVIWLSLPGDGAVILDSPGFWYRSAYVENTGECADLVASADAALLALLGHASVIAGHQLCSDLAVLAATTGCAASGISAATASWRQRRDSSARPRFVDTRYDAGHILTGQSRRLVDVCAEVGLEVTQPELRGTSMTALHRQWVELGDVTAREKITVLNLRHSLSTAIVAARAAGLAHWQPGLNVNRLLARELTGTFGWASHPAFAELLGGPDAA
jgi:hypothetical protein